MCMTPEQKRKKEEAREESMRDTRDVNATGERSNQRMYSDFPNQINNE